MEEEFEEWFEKFQDDLEFNFMEQNWESFREFARDEFEVGKDYYEDKEGGG